MDVCSKFTTDRIRIRRVSLKIFILIMQAIQSNKVNCERLATYLLSFQSQEISLTTEEY